MNFLPAFLAVAVFTGLSDGGSHSLRYFYTGISGISEFPEFVALGYVDDQTIGKYESTNQVYKPHVQWMEENEDQGYWDKETQTDQGWQQAFKANVKTLMDRTNQTTGIHSLQLMYGCSMNDGTSSGFFQYGYDGNEYIAFDKERQTWTAVATTAYMTKTKWDPDTAYNTYWKNYLEKECTEWLQKYMKYGQSVLGKIVPPEAKMIDIADSGSTKLKCTVSGFHPQAIDVYFVKGDNDKIETATSTEVLPNNDGTYYIEKWIETDPQDKYHHSCHIEHESLKSTLIVKLDQTSSIALIVGIVIAVVAVILIVVIAVVIWKKKQKGGKQYTPANKNDHAESSSNSSENA